MEQVLGDILPLAIGAALSPIPIIAVVLILGTPRARSNGPAFAAGWVLALVAVSIAVLVLAGNSDDSESGSSTTVAIVLLILGLAFLVLAAKQWRSRPRPGEQATMPEWMSTLDRIAPGKAFVFGLALAGVNPKNLALTIAAAASIAQAGLSSGDEVLAVAVFVVVASITVAGAVVLYLVGGDRASKWLASIKEFMSAHNAVIMMVILLVLGVKLIGDGIAGLTD